MIAVSRSLTASEVSIATVEAALSTEFGQNPPLPRWSPSLLPAANDQRRRTRQRQTRRRRGQSSTGW